MSLPRAVAVRRQLPVQLRLGNSERRLRARIAGLKVDRGAEVDGRFDRIAALLQQRTEIKMRSSKTRLELERATETSQRFVALAGIVEHRAQSVLRVRVVRLLR